MSNRKNLANGILALGVSDTDTTWVLQNGYGAGMPDVPFYLTATPFGQLSTMGNSEIVNVTERTTDTLTVQRGAKGTTAKTFAAGAVVSNGIYVEDLNSIPGDLDVDGDIYSNGELVLTSLNVTNSTAFANSRSITTSFVTIYTATSFCFVNVYLDYISTGKSTVVRAGGVEKYLSPQYGRGNVGAFLNVGQTVEIKADTAYTVGWMRIDVQSF